MGDLVFAIDVLVAGLACLLTPIFVVVKSIETYRLVKRDRAVYVFKAGLAFGIWVPLSIGMTLPVFGYLMASAHQRPGAATDWSWLIGFNLVVLAYAAVGFGLGRWMMRRE